MPLAQVPSKYHPELFGLYSQGTGRGGERGSWGLLLRTHLISCHCVPHRILLSTFHYLLLVFLKLPLFLSMLIALLCVSRSQRGPGRRGSQADKGDAPCSAQAPGMACPGRQPFALDKRDLQALQCRAGKTSVWVQEGFRPSGGMVPVPQRKGLDLKDYSF